MLKLTISGKTIAKTVTFAATVAPPKSTRPIMSHILVNGTKEGLELIASDQDIWVRLQVEGADVQSEGSVLLKAVRLKELVKEFDDEDITLLEKKNSGCVIKASEAKFSVSGEDPEDYPPFPDDVSEKPVCVDSSLLAEMLSRVVSSVNSEKGQFSMHGALLQSKDKMLNAVGTDGKRLAVCTASVDQDGELSGIIPKHGVETLIKLLKQHEGDIKIHAGESYLRFVGDDWEIATRLVEGKFPPWETVDERVSGHSKTISVPRDRFGQALRRSILLEQTDTQAVRFDFNEDGLTLTTRAADVEDSCVTLGLNYPYEDPITLGLNPSFFLDVLKFLDSPFPLLLQDSKNAVVIRAEEENGLKLLYVMMPINLGK